MQLPIADCRLLIGDLAQRRESQQSELSNQQLRVRNYR